MEAVQMIWRLLLAVALLMCAALGTSAEPHTQGDTAAQTQQSLPQQPHDPRQPRLPQQPHLPQQPQLPQLPAPLQTGPLPSPQGDGTGGQARTDKAQDQPKTDNTPLILEAIQREIARIAGAIEAQKDEAEAKRKEAREIRDLDAHERMAQWAEALFWAICATIFLTMVGILLIWRTLVHTRRAAEAAHKMVVESERATAAAIAAANEARRP